jgi:hypothetical protein
MKGVMGWACSVEVQMTLEGGLLCRKVSMDDGVILN